MPAKGGSGEKIEETDHKVQKEIPNEEKKESSQEEECAIYRKAQMLIFSFLRLRVIFKNTTIISTYLLSSLYFGPAHLPTPA